MHDLGFFDRADTRELIAGIGTPRDWTIYVGLGGTIDRTGVSWDALISRLLARFEPDADVRDLIVEKNGPVRSATMLESLYFRSADSDDAAVRDMQDSVRSVLYGPQRFMQGRILDSLAKFAFALALRGHSVSFVTPNYDVYLYEELKVHAKYVARESGRSDVLSESSVLSDDDASVPDGWDAPGTISCTYLHGQVGTKSESIGQPILGELSYHQSALRSQKALKQLFKGRHVLIVGSSVTDGPLVNALLSTAPGYRRGRSRAQTRDPVRRFTIQPLQSSEWRHLRDADLVKLRRWNSNRLDALGVTAIYPDFFGQVGQLINETMLCIVGGDAEKMMLDRFDGRYTERLEAWWIRWSKVALSDHDVQRIHHESLRDELEIIRGLIGAPREEALKLELWCRWDPHPRTRELALWASSVGTWPSVSTMRRDAIGLSSDYRAVQVFCAGAPLFLTADETDDSRWRSYLGLPVWHRKAQLPVGVISLASMRERNPIRPGDEPSVVCEENLDKLQLAIRHMGVLGEQLLGRNVRRGLKR